MHTSCQSSLPSAFWQGRTGREGTMGGPIFPFLSMPSFSAYAICCNYTGKTNKQTQIRKGMIDFVGPLCFLECHCHLLAFQANPGSWGLSSPSQLVITVIRLPCACFKSHWTPIHHESIGILCSPGTVNTMWMERRCRERGWVHVVHRTSVHTCASLSFQLNLQVQR